MKRAAVLFMLWPISAYATQCGGGGPELKEPAICSRLFLFSGRCGYSNYSYPEWPDIAFAVGAWEKQPIRISRVSVNAWIKTKWRSAVAMIFAGNSFNADPITPYRMAMAGISDIFGNVNLTISSDHTFNEDAEMQFPAGQSMPQTHLDVHLTCEPKGAQYSGNLTVWYRLDP